MLEIDRGFVPNASLCSQNGKRRSLQAGKPLHRQPLSFPLARARACNPVRYVFLCSSDTRISFFHAIYMHSARTCARVGRTFLACSCHLKRVRHVNRTCYARRASTAISSISVANCRVRLAFQEHSRIGVAESRLPP